MSISQAAAAVSSQSDSRQQKYLRSDSALAVIWKSVRIYVRHFVVLLLTVAIPTLPFDILAFAGLREGEGTLAIAAAIASSFAAVFAFSAVCVVGSDICVGNKPSLRRAYRRIFGAPFVYVTLNSLLVFLCLCGVVIALIFAAAATVKMAGILGSLAVIPVALFIMPLLALHVMYVPAISALEMKPGFRRALNRSSFLGRGQRIRAFMVLAVIGGFAAVGTFVLMMIATIPTLDNDEVPKFGPYLYLSLRLFLPLFAIATLLMYYDLRSRKEAFDFPSRDESIHD